MNIKRNGRSVILIRRVNGGCLKSCTTPLSDIERRFRKSLRNYGKRKVLPELATKAGLNSSNVGFIERAQRNPTLETISKLASALDVDIEELFHF